MATKHYYESRYDRREHGFYGVVYHYDQSGNREIADHRTGFYENSEDAINETLSWLGKHPEIDAELQ